MEIRRIIYALVRRWWIILLLVVLCGGTGYYLNVMCAQTLYSADTTLYFLNKDKVEAGQALSTQDLSMSQTLANQYSGIFYSRSVTSAAAKTLDNYLISEKRLASMVNISSEKDSILLTIDAVSPDPKIAAAAANAMANEFIALIGSITKSDFIGVLDEAQVPKIPIPNHGALKTLLFIFGGLVMALGIIYLLEYFDTTVRSSEDVEDHLKLRVIGIIPEHDIH